MSKKRAIGVIAIVVIVVAWVLGPLIVPGVFMGIQVGRAKVRLLRDTDHQALLEACLELSHQVTSGQLKDGVVYTAVDVSRLPEPIPPLRPNHVTVGGDGAVEVEMGSGWYPLGVRVYPEGYPEYPPPFKYGDRQLVKGLWYYEDGYSLHPEFHDKGIDALLSKNKKLKRPIPESLAR